MRYLLGFCLLGVAIYLVYTSLNEPNYQSIGKLLLSLLFLVASYICLRHFLLKPLEMLGFVIFLPSNVVNHNHRYFKEVNELIKSDKINMAITALDKILMKKPNWVDAQVIKLQLLGNNLYDIQKAKEFGETILLQGKFNRDKMQLLILLGGMLRKHGFPQDAVKISAQCRIRAPKHLQKLIDKMDEGWSRSQRTY